MSRASSDQPKDARVREVVLDVDGSLSSVRGVAGGELEERLDGLLEIARRAGRIGGQVDLSFFWKGDATELVFATVRTMAHEDRTSLSWAEPTEIPHGLTPRELDILTLLVGGLTNAEIGTRLWTSPRTVSTHVERILAKLALRTRAAAASVALEESLLLLPVPGGPEGFERLLIGMLSTPQPAEAPRTQELPWRRRGPSMPRTSRRSLLRPVLLGSAFPVTGEIAEDGQEMVRASRLAIDEVNQRGGIHGRPVQLVNVDVDIQDPVSIANAFGQLAANDVDAMVSGYLADQSIAHELAAEYEAPYLHAATLDSMVQVVRDNPGRYGNVFQVCPSDTNYGPGFVSAMSHLRQSQQLPPARSTLAIVRGRWKLGDLGIESAVELAERQGWTLDYVADDVEGEEAWRAQGRIVSQLAPAAVMIGSYFVHETVPFIRQFLADPSPTLLYSLYAPSIPRFRVEMGPQAEGILWATTTGTYSDQVAGQFSRRYREAYATSPGRSHAGIAYDRVRMLVGAWSSADSPRDFRSVVEALRQGVHRGVNGAYSLAGEGQAALAYPFSSPDPSLAMAHLVFQIQDNRQRIVYPSPYTEASLRKPPWWPK